MKIKTFDDLDQVLLELGQIETTLAKKEASMNTRIQNIRNEFDVDTKELREQKSGFENDIKLYCQTQQSEFEKQRSMPLVHGTVGFSKNPPKVVQLNKKWTVKSTLEFIKKLFEGKYVRNKEEVNKDEILADYAASVIDDSKLAAVGLRIEQDERFFYEINWESLNQKKATN